MTGEARTRLLRALVGLGAPALIAAALFLWAPRELYHWMKALHVVAVIGWMAGMFGLPLLFVYHCRTAPSHSETFKLMEQRLLTLVINPAMVSTWAIGAWLIWAGDWLRAEWLHLKLVLVLALSGLHGQLTSWTRRFAADQNRHGEKFYRAVSQVTALLLLAIVILAVVKPF